jgi:GT2 family glycosyltransferase
MHKGTPEAATDRCLSAAFEYMKSHGYTVAFVNPTGSNICRNRNAIVGEAFKSDAEWTLMVDDDMVFGPDFIERLMKHDLDIVTGLYVKKFYPHTPNVTRKDENGVRQVVEDIPENGLIEADGVGGGFVLIRTKVFKGIEPPWFAMPPNKTSPGGVMGEDYYFCEKAQGAGYKVMVDCSLVVGHLGLHPFTIVDYLINKEQQEEPEEKKIIVSA